MIKTADDAGCIVLGPGFAHRNFVVQEIPENEAWLWQNPRAKASVMRGLEQVAHGECSNVPTSVFDDCDDE